MSAQSTCCGQEVAVYLYLFAGEYLFKGTFHAVVGVVVRATCPVEVYVVGGCGVYGSDEFRFKDFKYIISALYCGVEPLGPYAACYIAVIAQYPISLRGAAVCYQYHFLSILFP